MLLEVGEHGTIMYCRALDGILLFRRPQPLSGLAAPEQREGKLPNYDISPGSRHRSGAHFLRARREARHRGSRTLQATPCG